MTGRRSTAVSVWVVGLLLLVLTGATACGARPTAGTSSASPSATSTKVVRYLPLGDSITAGYPEAGGYRTLLWQLLVRQDGDRIDFVGSMSSGPPELGDPDNEGHGGWCIDGPCSGRGDDVVATEIEGWLTTYRPDLVSVHLGTNDLSRGADGEETAARLDALLGRIYGVAPDVDVIVMQIVAAGSDAEQRGVYNASIPAIAARYEAAGRRVRVVDLSQTLTLPGDYTDGTHPTKSGYEQMARALYPAVSQEYLSLA